ncbi:MAG: hypothetical protein L0027_11060 [Candidatus Rokubacteria bacterium]|nr:hypothetical protein [Candidatus Rokubacteria bacterium]
MRAPTTRHFRTGGALLLWAAGLVFAAPAWDQPTGCAARLPVERVTLNLRDANVQTTLRLLASQYRVNLVVTDDVTARATFDFFQVPVRDVFTAIIDSNDLRCVEVGGVLRVSTAARIKAEEEERVKVQEARTRLEADTRKRLVEAEREQAQFAALQARGPITEETIRLYHADAEKVAETLLGILGLPPQGTISPVPLPGIYAPLPPVNIGESGLAPPTVPGPAPPLSSDALAQGLTVKAHKPTNSVFIRFYANDIERIRTLIQEKLDIPLPQVQIAAQIITTTQNALDQIGVQWGGAVVTTGSGPAVLGTGFSTNPASVSGLPLQPQGGTGVAGQPGNNPNFTGSSLLPISPATGVPVGGNLINLPVSFLPTLANPAAGLLFGIIGRNFNLNLAIQALELKGRARRLADPKVVTVENSKATIARGFEVPFVSQSAFGGTNVQFKDALLQLQVTPNVIKEGDTTRIRMKVVVDNNEPDFTRSVAGNPSFFKRKTETEVVVREGERLVIGGIILDTRSSTVRQVPWFGNIPVLGWLFKSRELSSDSEELIVIITPSVVGPGPAVGAR